MKKIYAKMKQQITAIAIIGLCIIFLSLMWKAAHRNNPAVTVSPTPTPTPTTAETPYLTRLFPSGQKQWRITASSLEVNNKTNKGKIKKIVCELLNQNQVPYLKATARAGDLDMKDRSIDFEGAVRATGTHGESAKINKLFYDGTKNRFIGTQGIHVVKEASELFSDEMEIDPENKNIEARGRVMVIYRSKGKAF